MIGILDPHSSSDSYPTKESPTFSYKYPGTRNREKVAVISLQFMERLLLRISWLSKLFELKVPSFHESAVAKDNVVSVKCNICCHCSHTPVGMVSLFHFVTCALLATITNGTPSPTPQPSIFRLSLAQQCEGRAITEFTTSMPFLKKQSSKNESNFCIIYSHINCYFPYCISNYITMKSPDNTTC